MLKQLLIAAFATVLGLSAGCGESKTLANADADADVMDEQPTDSADAEPEAAGAPPAADDADGGAPDVAPVDLESEVVPDDVREDGDAEDASDSDDPGSGETGEVGADSDGPAPICSGAGCPPEVAPGHLQLWLRGDQGVDCLPQATASRVTRWRDLSGHDRHAVPPDAKVGPICGMDTINGHATVTFPRTEGLQGEEYLEVDLASLVDTGFTVAVVERRSVSVNNSFMLGSRLPYPDAIRCAANVNANRAILLGYPASSVLVAGTWGVMCDINGTVTAPPVPTSVIVMSYEPTAGLKLFLGGSKLGESASEGLKAIGKGLIGRGFDFGTGGKDARYGGQIAEIVVFDTALADDARHALESYLRSTWTPGP